MSFIETLRNRTYRYYHFIIAGFAAFILLIVGSIIFSGFLLLADFQANLYFDAEHYQTIAVQGYLAYHSQAFFPLFPLLWKLSTLGPLGISILNFLLVIVSSSWIASKIDIEIPDFLLFVLSPGLVFFLLPYSESVFFVSGIFVLVGLKEQNPKLRILGLILSSFSRPAFSVFAPALIILHILRPDKYSLRALLTDLLILFCSFFVVMLSIDFWNGEWLQFFEVQKLGWGNEFRIPELPFKTWSNTPVLVLDLTALFIGLICGIFLIKLLVNRIRKASLSEQFSPDLIFAMSYLAGITLLIVLFRGGMIFSLNRFVFATIYFAWLLWHLKVFKIGKKELIIFALGLMVLFLCHGAYVHLKVLIQFLGSMALFILIIYSANSERQYFRFASLVLLFVLQLYLLHRVFTYDWIA